MFFVGGLHLVDERFGVGLAPSLPCPRLAGDQLAAIAGDRCGEPKGDVVGAEAMQHFGHRSSAFGVADLAKGAVRGPQLAFGFGFESGRV